ncbi:hypothetical protein EDB87DRAFT_1640161 [Lactarius vividus]|nr:hypothetical protein EDB87DRAFT_1640161 [Lactarius vividus]
MEYARKLLGNVGLDNAVQPSAKLGKRPADIRGLLDRLDSFMLSINESLLNPRLLNRSFLPCHTCPHPSPESPSCQWSNGLHHPRMSGQVFSSLRLRRLPRPQMLRTSTCSLARPTSPKHFCCQIERCLRPAHGAKGTMGYLHLCYRSTARRYRRSWQHRGESWREPGGDEAGAAARSLREGTRSDVPEDIERRRRRNCIFGHVIICQSVPMRGDGRRPLASW